MKGQLKKQQLSSDVKAKKSEWYYFKKNSQLTMLALPTILVIFVLNYLPLYGLIIPFKTYNVKLGVLRSPWAGLKNFRFLFNDSGILTALKNTMFYNLIFIFLGMAVSVILALMLYELSKRAVKVYQTAMLVPYFMSWVVVAYIVNAMLDMDHGILNNLLSKIGMSEIMWYNEAGAWPFILVFCNIIKNAGYNAVIYFAALSSIDKSYFEAAQLDGANRIQQIIHITLPHLKSIIVIMIILNIGKIFYGDFGLFYNVPLNSSLLYSATDVIDTYVYRALMEIGNLGISSTTGFCQAVLGFILVLTTNYIAGKVDGESKMF